MPVGEQLMKLSLPKLILIAMILFMGLVYALWPLDAMPGNPADDILVNVFTIFLAGSVAKSDIGE